MRIGVQIHPQHCSMEEILQTSRACDDLGVDTLWTWDHFFPLYGYEGAPHPAPVSQSPHAQAHFEGWITLTAMACHTRRAELGLLVGCNSYRNPHLVADMARTLDHVAGGRSILGIGSGWFDKDYEEYGYEFGTAGGRLKDLEKNLPILKERLAKLNPLPKRNPIPIMIGGGGEKVTLRLVAEHAQLWNGLGTPEEYARKSAILDDWCAKVGRDPKEIERTLLVNTPIRDGDHGLLDEYARAGVQHIIVGIGWPFALDSVKSALEWKKTR